MNIRAGLRGNGGNTMSEDNRRTEHEDGCHSANTLDIDGFEPLSDGLPEEYDPEDADLEYDDAPRSFTERLLSGVTITLSLLLTAGSVVFWWYFVSRLCICPAAVNNYRLYPAMLAACASVALAVTIAQAMRRRTYPSPESWMINICSSGAITTVLMVIYNSAVLGNAFEWGDVLPTLCFSVSGCAMPAAVFAVIWALVLLLIDHVRYENSKDRGAVLADVLAQCKGRFR